MSYSNQFLIAVGETPENQKAFRDLSKRTGIPVSRLRYYNDRNIIPTGDDLEVIQRTTGVAELELRLRMGRLDSRLIDSLRRNAPQVLNVIDPENEAPAPRSTDLEQSADFQSDLGTLFNRDCMTVLQTMDNDTVDMVFADPPFNLNKLYPSGIDDDLKEEKYLLWTEQWLRECIRVLKPGGSLLVWNLPKWNAAMSGFLSQHLTFRHWIAVDIKYRLPINGRLYPSHYGLLYYVNGDKPNVFHPDRLPMPTCPKCDGDLRDYGGYKNKMNPRGVNLSDIWTDIPPVRHAKYKRRNGANELSLKLLDRVLEMTTDPGDLVFDPFGGSGTTYMAAEIKGRRWIGCEIGPIDDIVERFAQIKEERQFLENYRSLINKLFPDDVKRRRLEKGLWTPETLESNNVRVEAQLSLLENSS